MLDQHLLSRLDELGARQKTYADETKWIILLVFVGCMIMLSLAMLSGDLNDVSPVISPIGMLLLFIFVLITTLSKPDLRISIYERGLLYQNRRHRQVILWSDIQSLDHKVTATHDFETTIIQHTYTLQSWENTVLLTLRFDGTWSWQKRRMAVATEQAISAALAPPILLQGKACPFGPLTLSQEGISHNGKMLPWNEVESVVPTGIGTIVIRRPGDSPLTFWTCVLFDEVPNLAVMLKVLDMAASTHHFRRQARGWQRIADNWVV